jgi:hypothetical protein
MMKETEFKATAGAVPLPIAIGMRGAEGCVSGYAGEHTPDTTRSGAPPLERGVAVISLFSTIYSSILRSFQSLNTLISVNIIS